MKKDKPDEEIVVESNPYAIFAGSAFGADQEYEEQPVQQQPAPPQPEPVAQVVEEEDLGLDMGSLFD